MHTLLLLSLLAQAPVVVQPASTSARAPTRHTFSDGQRTHTLYESTLLVAEVSPQPAFAQQLLQVDPTAVAREVQPTMRVWRVRDVAAVRAAFPALRPVFTDLPDAGRWRVVVGLVCGATRRDASAAEAFAASGADCLPDFWYRPHRR